MIQIDQAAIGHILNSSTEEKQVLKCIEEMSELQKELCRYLEDGIGSFVLEEMADVLITIEQMKIIFGINEDSLNSMIGYKIGRTLSRFEKREENNNG